MWDFESFIFWSKFRFLEDRFNEIVLRQPTMVDDIFTQPLPPPPP